VSFSYISSSQFIPNSQITDADAVIKCLATAVSTGILLYVSPLLFGTPMNPLIAPGAIIVLVSSWMYVESALPKDQEELLGQTASTRRTCRSVLGAIAEVCIACFGIQLQYF